MDQLLAMRVFARVAERGSFGQAADELDISRAAASGHVAALERHLGVRLLNRTTRRVGLTAEGAEYLRRCRRILDDIEDAEETLRGARSRPQGLLRVDVPVALPEGVSFAGNFGRPEDLTGFAALGLTVAAEDEGLRVFAVAPGSPAESAGIAAGDLVAGCVPAAGLVRLVVERDGVRREVTFRLAR